MEKKYKRFKKSQGDVFNMSVDEIRKIHYTQKAREEGRAEGREEGRKEEKIKIAKSLLDILDIKIIAEKTGLTVEEIEKFKY